MTKIRNKFDFEHAGRIKEISKSLHSKNEFYIEDIISNTTVATKFENQKLIISHFDREKILLSYPFNNEIYVTFCRNCLSWTNMKELKLLLEYHAFVPVLTSPYNNYPEAFQNLIIQYPHISVYEFSLLRSMILFSISDKGICPHCIERMKKEYKQITNIPIRGYKRMIDDLFTNLDPYIEPDYELLYEFGKSVNTNDEHSLKQIIDLSLSVWDARTAQALNGRLLFHSSSLSSTLKRTSKIISEKKVNEEVLIQSALAQNIRIEIPENSDISKYFKCIDPYRAELSDIVDSIIIDSNNAKDGQILKLNNSLSIINEQVKQLSRNKKYLTYQAILGFTRTNKLLIGSVLVASVFGLVPGCGALAATIATKLVKKYGNMQMPEEALPLLVELKHVIRPQLNKLIAKYTGVDYRAMQLFEINKSLEKDFKKMNDA